MDSSSDPALCPHCGRLLATSPSADAAVVFGSVASQTVETLVPATHCGDEPGYRPGGHNGFILAERPTGPEDGSVMIPPGLSQSDDSEPAPIDGSSEFDPLNSPIAADPILEVFAASGPDGEKPTSGEKELIPVDPRSASVDEEARATPWPFLLLASYASAMTIAVAWLLWHGHARKVAQGDTLPVPARATSSRDLRPLPPERRTSIHKPLRVGSLEITPLELTQSPVRLVWTDSDGDRRFEKGPESLVLRLLFKNVGSDESFAPLESAWVRRADSGEGDAFLINDSGIIEVFPLALASEKAIVGQKFPLLKPGEEAETIVVAEAGSISSPATWRLKVRVNGDRTAVIGVDVRPEDVK